LGAWPAYLMDLKPEQWVDNYHYICFIFWQVTWLLGMRWLLMQLQQWNYLTHPTIRDMRKTQLIWVVILWCVIVISYREETNLFELHTIYHVHHAQSQV